MKKYTYTSITFALFVFLFLPFILKLKNEKLEIYPAVIFPSGAGLMNTNNDQISFIEVIIYAGNDTLKKISKKEILGEIPVQYFTPILEADFGLSSYNREFKLYKPPIKFKISNNFNEFYRIRSIKWLRERLNSKYAQDSILKIKTFRKTINKYSGEIIAIDQIHEKTYRLY